MSASRIPVAAWLIWGLHAAWGVVVFAVLPVVAPEADVGRPVLVMAWVGSATMIVIASMVAATMDWRPRALVVMGALLLPDLAALVLVMAIPAA